MRILLTRKVCLKFSKDAYHFRVGSPELQDTLIGMWGLNEFLPGYENESKKTLDEWARIKTDL